jgi:hypothetical protein
MKVDNLLIHIEKNKPHRSLILAGLLPSPINSNNFFIADFPPLSGGKVGFFFYFSSTTLISGYYDFLLAGLRSSSIDS